MFQHEIDVQFQKFCSRRYIGLNSEVSWCSGRLYYLHQSRLRCQICFVRLLVYWLVYSVSQISHMLSFVMFWCKFCLLYNIDVSGQLILTRCSSIAIGLALVNYKVVICRLVLRCDGVLIIFSLIICRNLRTLSALQCIAVAVIMLFQYNIWLLLLHINNV